jgi:hypothetical protein
VLWLLSDSGRNIGDLRHKFCARTATLGFSNMTAKWPSMDRFWAPELAKQACSRAVNIGDWRCRLLGHEMTRLTRHGHFPRGRQRRAQRDQLASAGQLDWIEELLIPRQADYDRNSPK